MEKGGNVWKMYSKSNIFPSLPIVYTPGFGIHPLGFPSVFLIQKSMKKRMEVLVRLQQQWMLNFTSCPEVLSSNSPVRVSATKETGFFPCLGKRTSEHNAPRRTLLPLFHLIHPEGFRDTWTSTIFKFLRYEVWCHARSRSGKVLPHTQASANCQIKGAWLIIKTF